MNSELLKDYYSINEVCSFMSEKLNESFKPFDILFSMGKHDINLCFYHSGFIGVADWYRVIGESLERRIPFDGILEIPHISHIQEVLEKEEIFVSDVKPSYWVRHKDKKIRLVEELLKFEEPQVCMVDYSNSIIAKNIPINALIISDDSLIHLIGIFKNKATSKNLEKSEIKLSTRTKNNYLRLILTLANNIKGFNPKKPYEAAKLIIDETETDISLETLANYIKEAYEIESKERD